MKRLIMTLAVVALGMAAAGTLFATGQGEPGAPATYTIKVASLVPENTEWGKALNKMAKNFSDATNGKIKMVVYAGGIVSSNEVEVYQKLKQNQIQAAIFTSSGMSYISTKIMALSCPFLIRDNDELNYVLKALKPKLEAIVEQSGYKILAWSKAGWVRAFGRNPIFTPDDLRKQRLATGNELPALSNAMKTLGFTLTVMPYNDYLTALTSGRVDAFFNSPVYTASMQLFGVAKNMCSLNVAPFMGGIVINQQSWRRIPQQYKDKLLAICSNLEAENDNAIIGLEKQAIDVMTQNGLTVDTITPEQRQLWEAEGAAAMPSLTSGSNPLIDPDLYKNIQNLLADYRTTHGQ